MTDRELTHSPRPDAARPSDAASAAHHAARIVDDAPPGASIDAPPAEGASGRGEISPAAGVAGGAVAGTMAGLQAGALAGALTLGLGAVAGAAMGAAAGAALSADSRREGFTAEHDAHYRALHEGRAVADRGYDDVRAAYAFGHLAAAEPALADREFAEVEPELRAAWTDELRTRAGSWDAVRAHVRDAFGHARAEGTGARRDNAVVGSAGSAVDPVELDRARRGLPSDGRPLVGDGDDTQATRSRDAVELPANAAHRHDAELR